MIFALIATLISCQSNTKSSAKKVVSSLHNSGQIEYIFSQEAGGKRSFFLTLPDDYSKENKYKLVIIFSGTNATGKNMKDYVGSGWNGVVGLESNMPNTIFVYPDPKWRYFPEWGKTYGGWLLGLFAGPAEGMEDIYFVSELLDWVQNNYSVDRDRIFVTGHSWGGDMAAVVGCFLGDRFTAVVPVAANRPYWFDDPSINTSCKGSPAIWTFFGKDDDYFKEHESYSGDFGIQQNEFWTKRFACDPNSEVLEIEPIGESVEFKNCQTIVRLTLYSPDFSGGDFLPGHQPPDFFLSEVPKWFNSF